jgi:hypothetical protein
MADNVEYEVFDEERPTYVPSYIMSAFVLMGVASLAYYRVPLWPLTLVHAFMAVWFGVLFYWILLETRQRRMFSSFRLRITDKTYAHTFRYAVAEATHFEMPLAEIVQVKVSTSEPHYIEVKAKSEDDLYFLPPHADIEGLLAALRKGNPGIRVVS